MKVSYNILDILFETAKEVTPVANARVTSCIVFKGKIIAVGQCKEKTHPFQKQYSKHTEAIKLHAENDVIVKALKKISINDLKRSTLYVARAKKYNRGSKFIRGLAKPCTGCQSAIAAIGIKNVVYTTEDGFDIL